jgi:hypothetical protein
MAPATAPKWFDDSENDLPQKTQRRTRESQSGSKGETRLQRLERVAIACVGQFGKLSHDQRPIAAVCPRMQLQTDLYAWRTKMWTGREIA